jgi:glycosyltransferase involved in cell wall biosynthesis
MNGKSEFNNFPKVLIIGQPFHNKSGGGITISNLFKNFPSSKIALAANSKSCGRNDFTYCKNVYRLGKSEYKIYFPFNFFFKRDYSGVVCAEKQPSIKTDIIISKKKWYYNILENIFIKLGINLFSIRIKSSENFEKWIKNFDPDIIYTQLGSIELLFFIEKLIKTVKIPLAIHIMDDWPISMGRGPIKLYWKWLIDKKLKSIIKYSAVNLAISEGMSTEYSNRYKAKFNFFHNPIDLAKWKIKTDINVSNKRNIKILYTGRVTGEHYKSLEDICIAINKVQIDGQSISIDIYSPDWDTFLIKKLTKYPGVFLFPSIDHSEIPELLIKYDILFLPLEFSAKSIEFTKFSMPTKSSEYMISGVPILVYAPVQTELNRHFSKNKLAYVIGERNVLKLVEGITKLVTDEKYRNKISKNAAEYAKLNYNSEFVRNGFLDAISLNKK